jgi:phosphoribosyl-ATP pyrophosphohydrolase
MSAQEPTTPAGLQLPLGDAAALADALGRLAAVIDARAGDGSPADSWTAKLLADGPTRCAKKLGEEGVEAALAVAAGAPAEVAAEGADLLYHLLVALRSRGVSLDDVARTLAARAGVSGLSEKASRTPSGGAG